MADFIDRKSRRDFLKNHSNDESPKVKKDTALVTSERYKTPKTSPLIFHFEPHPFTSSELRLRDSTINKEVVEGRDIYIFDDFFLGEEGSDLREFSKGAEFSRTIFADSYSKDKGEEPARAMDNKEKWKFFANPPGPVKEIYKLLSTLAYRLDADIATLPWELYDKDICAPAVATNYITNMTAASMELGKHEDYNTEEGIAFGVPVLYSKEEALHPSKFVNGEVGRPWLVSLMLYSTSEGFKPEYGMGTVFCTDDKKTVSVSKCRNMHFVLFEGNIVHGIEESKLPSRDQNVWRVSYVFKLTINPRKKDISLKKAFSDLIKSYKKGEVSDAARK